MNTKLSPETIAEIESDLDQVVFTVRNQRITRRVAHNLFHMVEPRDNWKSPIDAVVYIWDDRTLAALEYAITFFTGSVATVERLGSHHYRISAAGYYAAIGA